MSDYYTRQNCRLCASKNLRQVFSLTPTPPANAFVPANSCHVSQECYPLDVYQCESCAHVQLLTVVDPSVLFKNYVYVSGTSPVFVQHFESYAKKLVLDYQIKPGDLVVDIGSNDGTLLKAFQQHDISVLGIDPAESIALKATSEGVETWSSFFSESTVTRITQSRKKPRIICANNVFAHSDTLVDFVRNVKKLLADDGVFVFEVSYLADVYTKTLFDMTYHEHVAYHSVIPLDALFKRESMMLIDVQRIPTHGGSIRCVVQHQHGPYRRDASVDALISLEKTLKIDRPATWLAYGDQIEVIKERLSETLQEIKRNGGSIIGYGAPAKATTLMYHFDIDRSLIDFIVDDSPLKQGLYSPGLHIPIRPFEAILEHKPEYILILAWNFSTPIMNKVKEKCSYPVKFVVPLPNVELV